jgi:hypothetical protein
MSNWNVYTKTGSGDTWEADGTIPRPNENMDTQILTNSTRVKLASGASGFFTPTVKSYKEAFTFVMLWLDRDVVDKIDGYINNNTLLKIETHTDEVFIGKITTRQRAWLTGVEPDIYDLMVSFQPYE